jgi:hypothetical protein
LENYYQVVFSLAQHHKYSIADIENMYPFERDIYLDLLEAYIKKQEEEAQNA